MSHRWGHGAFWTAGTSRLSRSLYAFAIFACALLAASHLVGLSAAVTAAWPVWGVGSVVLGLLGATLGVLTADFATGLAHWACDTYGDETTPLIGAGVIHSFREHHRDPRAMLAHDALEVNGQPAAVSAGLFVLLGLSGAQAVLRDDPFVYAFAWTFLGVGALGNQLHLWSHQPAPPAWVLGLQRRRWILSPKSHGRHHCGAHDAGYCIATGWCNPALDALRFWRALEWAIERVTGWPPRVSDRPL